MELVTGRAGSPHITSQQDRQKHQGIWGTGAYILNTGNNLEAVVQSSNNIQIKDGALMSQGALFSVKVGTVDEVTIANGSQGMMRKDVIVARYTYNQGTNTENAEWAVVQGTPAASNPQIPQITEGDIQAGDATVDTSVFIVTLDGINITSVDVVPELAPDIPEIMDKLNELNDKMTGAFSASDIQSAVVSGVRGGWKRVGDIVFVDVKFNLTNSYKDAVIMKNLPIPKNDKAALAAVNLSANRIALGRIQANGDLEWHDTAQPATGNECSITGIYNCV